jgi:hypothetical protein
MKTKLISSKFKYLIASLLMITPILLIAASPVYAAGKIRMVREVPISSNLSNDQLSAMFHHDQIWFSSLQSGVKQDANLPALNERLSTETGTSLRKAKRDLFKYQVNLGRAQSLDREIQMIINAHAGFAANGEVVNRVFAAQTLSRLDFFLNNTKYWKIHAQNDYLQAQRVAR